MNCTFLCPSITFTFHYCVWFLHNACHDLFLFPCACKINIQLFLSYYNLFPTLNPKTLKPIKYLYHFYNVHVYRQTSNRLVLCSRIRYKLINLVHFHMKYVTQLSISTNGVFGSVVSLLMVPIFSPTMIVTICDKFYTQSL